MSQSLHIKDPEALSRAIATEVNDLIVIKGGQVLEHSNLANRIYAAMLIEPPSAEKGGK